MRPGTRDGSVGVRSFLHLPDPLAIAGRRLAEPVSRHRSLGISVAAGGGERAGGRCPAVLLVTDFVLDRPIAFLLSAVTGLWFLAFWVLLPFSRRNWGDGDIDDDEDPSGLSEG